MKTIACLVLALSLASISQAAPPKPPPVNHPILATWTFTLLNGKCSETYALRQNGTMSATSGDEVAEAAYEISAKPSAKGFYRWVVKITKDNGKKDCAGQVMQLGHEATNFVRIDSSEMIVCERESLDACVGPFRRPPGNS